MYVHVSSKVLHEGVNWAALPEAARRTSPLGRTWTAGSGGEPGRAATRPIAGLMTLPRRHRTMTTTRMPSPVELGTSELPRAPTTTGRRSRAQGIRVSPAGASAFPIE